VQGLEQLVHEFASPLVEKLRAWTRNATVAELQDFLLPKVRTPFLAFDEVL